MRVCACVSTYNRPHLLPYILWCFERQTHADKHLLIYDDHGQYEPQTGPGWTLHSEDDPQPTLGAKRTMAMELADCYCQPDVFAIWDDDEYYYPHALESLACAAESGAWLRPSEVWHLDGLSGELRRCRTYGAADRADKAYQSTWGIRRDVYEAGLVWPEQTYTEDRAYARRLLAAGVPEADPLARGRPPYAIYDPFSAADRLSRCGGALGWCLPTGVPCRPPALRAARPPLPDSILDLSPDAQRLPSIPRPWGPWGDWLEREVASC